MAVKTHIYGVPLTRFRSLVGSQDDEVVARLEARWFGEKAIADQEKIPDRTLMAGILRDASLYDELDDETSLRLDKMIMVLMDSECGAQLQAFQPMRDDVQLLGRGVRESGKDNGLGELLNWIANGRRFGDGEEPIDVPHYAFLEGDELARLETQIGSFLESAKPKGVMGKLFGGKHPLTEEQQGLLSDLSSTLKAVRARDLDLFTVNQDPDARWDMA